MAQWIFQDDIRPTRAQCSLSMITTNSDVHEVLRRVPGEFAEFIDTKVLLSFAADTLPPGFLNPQPIILLKLVHVLVSIGVNVDDELGDQPETAIENMFSTKTQKAEQIWDELIPLTQRIFSLDFQQLIPTRLRLLMSCIYDLWLEVLSLWKTAVSKNKEKMEKWFYNTRKCIAAFQKSTWDKLSREDKYYMEQLGDFRKSLEDILEYRLESEIDRKSTENEYLENGILLPLWTLGQLFLSDLKDEVFVNAFSAIADPTLKWKFSRVIKPHLSEEVVFDEEDGDSSRAILDCLTSAILMRTDNKYSVSDFVNLCHFWNEILAFWKGKGRSVKEGLQIWYHQTRAELARLYKLKWAECDKKACKRRFPSVDEDMENYYQTPRLTWKNTKVLFQQRPHFVVLIALWALALELSADIKLTRSIFLKALSAMQTSSAEAKSEFAKAVLTGPLSECEFDRSNDSPWYILMYLWLHVTLGLFTPKQLSFMYPFWLYVISLRESAPDLSSEGIKWFEESRSVLALVHANLFVPGFSKMAEDDPQVAKQLKIKYKKAFDDLEREAPTGSRLRQ